MGPVCRRGAALGWPPRLLRRLRSVCPGLPRERIDFGVTRFTSTNIEVGATSDAGDVEWTDEEADGAWYDRMRRVALDCIEEASRVSAIDTLGSARQEGCI